MVILVFGGSNYAVPLRHTYPDAEIICIDTSARCATRGELEGADLALFTGGADVSPSLYGEIEEAATCTNPARDLREVHAFAFLSRSETPMLGICRGSQFLRVMCGGALYQHIEGHGIAGTHNAICQDTSRQFQVTSTHHQSAVDSENGEADDFTELLSSDDGIVEAWHNEVHDCIGVQYHPEYMDPESEGFLYFQSLVRFLMIKNEDALVINYGDFCR